LDFQVLHRTRPTEHNRPHGPRGPGSRHGGCSSGFAALFRTPPVTHATGTPATDSVPDTRTGARAMPAQPLRSQRTSSAAGAAGPASNAWNGGRDTPHTGIHPHLTDLDRQTRSQI